MKTTLIKVYCIRWCGPCNKVKEYLIGESIPFEEIKIEGTVEEREMLLEISGQRGVPVTVYEEKVVVGYNVQELDEIIKAFKVKNKA